MPKCHLLSTLLSCLNLIGTLVAELLATPDSLHNIKEFRPFYPVIFESKYMSSEDSRFNLNHRGDMVKNSSSKG
jgi:hypothetical protein